MSRVLVSLLATLWLTWSLPAQARPLDDYLAKQSNVLGVWVPYHEADAKAYEVVVYTGGPPPTLTLVRASDKAATVIDTKRLPGVNPKMVTGLMCSYYGEIDDSLVAQFGKQSIRDKDGSWAKPENVWLIRKDRLSPAGLDGVQCLLQSEGHE